PQRVDLLARRPLELLDAPLELVRALGVCHRHGGGTEHQQHSDGSCPRTSLKSHIAPPDGWPGATSSWRDRDHPFHPFPAKREIIDVADSRASFASAGTACVLGLISRGFHTATPSVSHRTD